MKDMAIRSVFAEHKKIDSFKIKNNRVNFIMGKYDFFLHYFLYYLKNQILKKIILIKKSKFCCKI